MATQMDKTSLAALPPTTRPARWRWLTALAPIWTFFVLLLFFSLASQSFLRPANLQNILVQISTLAISHHWGGTKSSRDTP